MVWNASLTIPGRVSTHLTPSLSVSMSGLQCVGRSPPDSHARSGLGAVSDRGLVLGDG